MFGKKHRQEVAAEAQQEEQEAMRATETDDSSIDPNETLEAEEEPES